MTYKANESTVVEDISDVGVLLMKVQSRQDLCDLWRSWLALVEDDNVFFAARYMRHGRGGGDGREQQHTAQYHTHHGESHRNAF